MVQTKGNIMLPFQTEESFSMCFNPGPSKSFATLRNLKWAPVGRSIAGVGAPLSIQIMSESWAASFPHLEAQIEPSLVRKKLDQTRCRSMVLIISFTRVDELFESLLTRLCLCSLLHCFESKT